MISIFVVVFGAVITTSILLLGVEFDAIHVICIGTESKVAVWLPTVLYQRKLSSPDCIVSYCILFAMLRQQKLTAQLGECVPSLLLEVSGERQKHWGFRETLCMSWRQ